MEIVFLTVFLGLLTFVLGQAFVKLVIDPVQEMRKTIGRIAHALTYLADVTSNPGIQSSDVNRDASKEFRKLSSELESHIYLVPLYPQTAQLFHLPIKSRVLEACKNMIGLSNSVIQDGATPVLHS